METFLRVFTLATVLSNWKGEFSTDDIAEKMAIYQDTANSRAPRRLLLRDLEWLVACRLVKKNNKTSRFPLYRWIGEKKWR